jgi:hypothetical protein
VIIAGDNVSLVNGQKTQFNVLIVCIFAANLPHKRNMINLKNKNTSSQQLLPKKKMITRIVFFSALFIKPTNYHYF